MIRVLHTQQEIAARVMALGKEISTFYAGKKPTVVVLLNGGMIFASDLVRAIDLDLRIDSMAVSSYAGEHSTGILNCRAKTKNHVKGLDLILVDDILDSGFTLKNVTEQLMADGAASVRTVVLFNKLISKKKYCKADWTGFELPDLFVVGYGLDADERYRNLPYLGVCEN